MTIENRRQVVRDFLLGSMEESERDAFEERLLAEEDLYFQVVDAENELIDRYVRNDLARQELSLFEESLQRFSGRRSKVENARVLQTFIAEQSQPLAASDGFFSRLATLFTSQFSTPAYAMAATILVLTVSLAFLIATSRGRDAELSRLKNDLANTANANVNRELANSQRKVEELQTAIDGERDTTGDLSADLQRERESRRRLEREVARLTNPDQTIPRPARDDTTVSVMRLDERSGNQSTLPEPDTESERLSILISLPVSVKSDERVSIQLNGKEIARNVAVRSVGKGLEVNATVMTDRLATGENVVTVHDALGNQIAKYSIGSRGKEVPERR